MNKCPKCGESFDGDTCAQCSDWMKFLESHLRDVCYKMAAPTIVSIWFGDDADARKIWLTEKIIRDVYAGYSTGPITMNAPGKPNMISYGFRDPQKLEIARRELRLPAELQAGPPIYIGPQPVERKLKGGL